MKNFKTIALAVLLAVFSSSAITAQDKVGELTTTTEITVKRGHNAQFVEGVKNWKECYLENNGQRKWGVWKREQGEGNVYVLVGTMKNWAEMDSDDPVNEACYMTLLNFISPHIEKVNYNISQVMPEVSRAWPADGTIAWVTYFKVNNGYAFKEVITAVGGAVKEKEGSPRGLWREYKGGASDAPDYMVATPFKSFAELDVKRDRPAKIFTDAVGEEKAGEMWDKWFETVVDSWSYIYVRQPELSN